MDPLSVAVPGVMLADPMPVTDTGLGYTTVGAVFGVTVTFRVAVAFATGLAACSVKLASVAVQPTTTSAVILPVLSAARLETVTPFTLADVPPLIARVSAGGETALSLTVPIGEFKVVPPFDRAIVAPVTVGAVSTSTVNCFVTGWFASPCTSSLITEVPGLPATS